MSVARINDIIDGWKTWRYVVRASADTNVTTLPPSQYATDLAAGRIIVVKPYTHVILRFFAAGSDTFQAEIYGYMEPAEGSRSTGPGPGFGLFQTTQTVDAVTIGTTVPPLSDGKWPLATQFYETSGTPTGTAISNKTGSHVATAATMYVVNCIGFTRLSLFMHTYHANCTAAGCVYRPFSFASTGASA